MYELESIGFSIWSDDEIRKTSVCEIYENKTTEKGQPLSNGLRDPRMGPLSHKKCVTCGLSKGECMGHFAHIELGGYFYNISWVTSILQILRCVCPNCGKSMVKENFVYDGPRSKLLQQISKSTFSKCSACDTKQSKYAWVRKKQCIAKDGKVYKIDEVKKHLQKFPDDLRNFLQISNPVSMLMSVLAVPPPQVRPPILSGSSIRGEDDLTYRLASVIRYLKTWKKIKEQVKSDSRRSVACTNAKLNVQIAITGYINHKKLDNPRSKSSVRKYKSLQPKLSGKEGRMRGNLMGKRCDFTGRSVITGDDTLGLNQVGVPIKIAEKLTIPVTVTDYNVNNLQDMLDNTNNIKFVIKPNIRGGRDSRIDLSFSKKRKIILKTGFQVERKLINGDIVLFNRQPSLHKSSMMAHEAVILPYDTFRINLSCTPPYNADFDGDEMNLHVCQTVEARAEAKHLMAVEKNFITPQNNRPVMSLIQDSLLGAYLITGKTAKPIARSRMMQFAMCIPG